MDLLTPSEVAKLLRLPVATLAQWRYRGQGPPFLRLGRVVRYDAADVAKFVQARKVEARNQAKGVAHGHLP
ncbi:MAG: helix-turn-helix transcriptional regulator [Terriglobales bacterium]